MASHPANDYVRSRVIEIGAAAQSRARSDVGGHMATFELSAHMTVRPGQLDGFKKQAAEIIRLTRQKDTQTLRYDWFLTNDGTECEVRELYTSPQGLIEHKAHIGAALHKLFELYADNHFMTIYGEPSPELVDLVKSLHMEMQIKWFSFVEGLNQ
jgi:quinol monooxygenase YgiN